MEKSAESAYSLVPLSSVGKSWHFGGIKVNENEVYTLGFSLHILQGAWCHLYVHHKEPDKHTFCAEVSSLILSLHSSRCPDTTCKLFSFFQTIFFMFIITG